jgi:hypothetical protein
MKKKNTVFERYFDCALGVLKREFSTKDAEN